MFPSTIGIFLLTAFFCLRQVHADSSANCPAATGGACTNPATTLFPTAGTCCFCTGPAIGGCSATQFLSEDGSSCCQSTSPVTVTTTTTVASVTTSTCVDLTNPATGVSDCPSRAYLCNNSIYYTLMTQQCPRTCNRCSSNTTTNSSCADLINPSTGVSDCSRLSYLCTNAIYTTLMRTQCPVTCGFCTTTSTITITSTCVDLTNPSTGVSDCSRLSYLCTNSLYTTLMRTQCPKSCGFCTTG